ncbi:hypothetical protein [Pseudomonas sp. TH10]|uniref:hypothetical protein n=1 Tax=Pseudomonas sp. TH10 TaxID=2796376 RepID=UPI00191402E7|nr:hypothetical protein [Pseudomonas sp. TH10]MBK5516426.1 hypothetical protein [Pseudomonas sp. TH10]
MTTRLVKTLIDEQVAELPDHLSVPSDRVLMVFKGASWADALHSAELASIENPLAWSRRACLCGEWTVTYEVRA